MTQVLNRKAQTVMVSETRLKGLHEQHRSGGDRQRAQLINHRR